MDRKYVRSEVISLLKEFGFNEPDQVLVEITVVGNRKIKELNSKFGGNWTKRPMFCHSLEDRNPGRMDLFGLGILRLDFRKR